ncbi:thiamine-phosphate kinase [Erythrobacter sp.]|uniref:thiamine-phosphate kinase n=1 Tax=Erythrobacter sp. TaxID=1042 RepID=UPI001B09C5BD|nr:thiamine-phosphate kinase [Erythrobacter sp.]MBO6526985.1 thiamine-phosphate kinase [Erythrobacter sp.]MBO6528866.1 thiamine-phosphate kinase [Erythrobacter sp.]
MHETGFIAALRALASSPAARGLEDDVAVIEIGGETLVLTHDTLIEGVHVREGEDPGDIAWKLVAVNLSDLAAKGAEPVGVLVSHMLGTDDGGFVAGLREVLDEYGTALLGGDTVRAEGRRVWGCTAIGRATHTPVPDRRNARIGEAIYVTGTLGRAMLGMSERGSGDVNDLAYRRPRPLLTEGRKLAPHVGAMMDVSDGLLLDGWRMARASGVGFALEREAIPVADAARFDDCIRWGDDYQLLFTAPASIELPVPAARIGIVERSDPVLSLDGRNLHPEDGLGYQH